MKNKIQVIILFTIFISVLLKAQDPISFFPKEAENKWYYKDLNTGHISFREITKDSIDSNGSHYLFYDNQTNPTRIIDTTYNVFVNSYPFPNYLLYKLKADSGDVWESQPGGANWAWIARVETSFVFSRPSIIKIFQYGPVHPDSLSQPHALKEDWLASGFGLIYQWREPTDIVSLIGCVIDSDTFGITTSIKPIENNIPADFVLKQNYPNPFNPITKIEYYIPKATFVTLKIYDIMGIEIKTLVSEEKYMGKYYVIWNGRNDKDEMVSSSIYFYKLETDENKIVRKMVFLK